MADFILRPATENDLKKLISIWCEAFGDDEGFVRAMLIGCGLLSTAVCAELDGAVRSAMFAFDGLAFENMKASYIYALCTEAAYRSRGLGRAVTAYAAEMARARGAEIVFLRPASRELENWYASALGALPFAGSSVEKFRPALPSPVNALEISAEEYLRRRGEQPWSLPFGLLRAEELIHRYYGGAFLSCGETLLCAEKCGHGLFIREICGPGRGEAIAAAAEYFGVDEAEILLGGEKGAPLMCLPPLSAANIEAIPPMPFTLD